MIIDAGTLAKAAWAAIMVMANHNGDEVVRWELIPVELRTVVTESCAIVYDTANPNNVFNITARLVDTGWREGKFDGEARHCFLAGENGLAKTALLAVASMIISVKEF